MGLFGFRYAPVPLICALFATSSFCDIGDWPSSGGAEGQVLYFFRVDFSVPSRGLTLYLLPSYRFSTFCSAVSIASTSSPLVSLIAYGK